MRKHLKDGLENEGLWGGHALLAWQRYKPMLGKIAAGSLAITAIVLGVKWYGAYMDAQSQDAYQTALTLEKRLIVADKYPDSRLAGCIWLEAADEAYNTGEYAKAHGFYERAVVSLYTTVLEDRARLGEALSAIKNSKITEGKAELKRIVDDAKALSAWRAEAAYHLALLEIQSGNTSGAQAMLGMIDSLGMQSGWIWQQKAGMLKTVLAPVQL